MKLYHITTVIFGIISSLNLTFMLPAQNDHKEIKAGQIALYYSDGSDPSYGLEAINKKLFEVGVRISKISIPKTSKNLLKKSRAHALRPQEAAKLIQYFHLDRHELVAEIMRSGRKPEMHRGGYLQTSEIDVAPYPKVYDMKALDPKTTLFLQHKFGKLHVNSSEAGVGIDEVMTIVSGGPYTWFFGFENNVVGKLRLGAVTEDGNAWRISYPGLVPHGGYFDASHGLVVAYAHGPKHFVMRYEDPSVVGYQLLGDNPWIDFESETADLLNRPKTSVR